MVPPFVPKNLSLLSEVSAVHFGSQGGTPHAPHRSWWLLVALGGTPHALGGTPHAQKLTTLSSVTLGLTYHRGDDQSRHQVHVSSGQCFLLD